MESDYESTIWKSLLFTGMGLTAVATIIALNRWASLEMIGSLHRITWRKTKSVKKLWFMKRFLSELTIWLF